jgi:hypothetical protein
LRSIALRTGSVCNKDGTVFSVIFFLRMINFPSRKNYSGPGRQKQGIIGDNCATIANNAGKATGRRLFRLNPDYYLY